MAARQRVPRAGPGEEPPGLSRGLPRGPDSATPVHQGGRGRVRPRRPADARAADPEPPALSPGGDVQSAKVDARLSQTERSEEHTSELQSRGHLVCRLLLEKKNAGCRALHSRNITTAFLEKLKIGRFPESAN